MTRSTAVVGCCWFSWSRLVDGTLMTSEITDSVSDANWCAGDLAGFGGFMVVVACWWPNKKVRWIEWIFE